MIRDNYGFTLMEILVAGMIAVIIIFAMTRVDLTRVRIQQELRLQAASQQQQAMLAVSHISKHLEIADRINRVSASNIQFRIPIANNLDAAASYRWDEYRLNAGNLEYFRAVAGPPCGTPVVLVEQITGLSFDFRDRAPDPPAGQVFAAGPEDNNVIEFTLTWTEAARSQAFIGEVTSRHIPYSDIQAGVTDSGQGLSRFAPGIPAVC